MSLFKDLLNPFDTKHPLDNPGGFIVGKYVLKGQNTADTRLNAIQVNRSAYGLPVPLVYGKTRIPITLLWYGGFKAIAHTTKQPGGKGIGGGGGGTNTSYTYTAAVVLGLCEGQISSIGSYWVDKAKHSALSDLGLTLFTGAGGQAVWSYLTTNAPTQAIPYDHTATLNAGALDLGSSASIPNLTAEVKALNTNATFNDDALPSDILLDYCTDANHGCGFPFLATLTGAGNTYESYCMAMGFALSPQEEQQRMAVDFIREVLQITNSDAVWTPGALRIVPYADTAVTGNGRTYTPDLTPIYSFGDSDYRYRKGQDPVRMTRTPPSQTYNIIRIEYLDRANDYNTAIAEASDLQDVALNGERAKSTLTFHSITDGAVARQVAQLILQYQLYIRNIFTFMVRADYSLLEPMDPVAITDSNLGISNQLVRILGTEDDTNHNFTITAAEMLVGTATAPRYDTQLAAGYAANYNTAPGPVATPFIVLAPSFLVRATSGYEMWLAAAGSAPSTWGGCHIYASTDGGVTYGFVGSIDKGPSRYGTIDATYASGGDPDTTHTLSVTLADPNLQLLGGTPADADGLQTTLLYVDGEVMAYSYVALDVSGGYTFTSDGTSGGTKYMRRGQYGTPIASHASSAPWMRIDEAFFRLPIDSSYIGQTVYFKFLSFNIYGHALEASSSVTAYSYVVPGVGIAPPVGVDIVLLLLNQITIKVSLPAYMAPGAVVELWKYSADTPFSAASKVAESKSDTIVVDRTTKSVEFYWVRIRETNGHVSPTFPASNGFPVVDGTVDDVPDDFTATGGVNGIQFRWSLPAYARLLGLLQLYEYTASTPFSSASLVWQGYAMGYFLPKTDTTTRYYWLVLNRDGILSIPAPATIGLAAAATSTTGALTANAFPSSVIGYSPLSGGGAGTATSNSTTTTATGGTPSYSYAWTIVSSSGGTITANSPTSATTTFSASHALNGGTVSGIARCTVTDSLSATATTDVAVTLNFPDIS